MANEVTFYRVDLNPPVPITAITYVFVSETSDDTGAQQIARETNALIASRFQPLNLDANQHPEEASLRRQVEERIRIMAANPQASQGITQLGENEMTVLAETHPRASYINQGLAIIDPGDTPNTSPRVIRYPLGPQPVAGGERSRDGKTFFAQYVLVRRDRDNDNRGLIYAGSPSDADKA